MSVVSKLSFTITGTQCIGPTRPDWANRASSASAAVKAPGFTVTIALSVGPLRSYASIRSM